SRGVLGELLGLAALTATTEKYDESDQFFTRCVALFEKETAPDADRVEGGLGQVVNVLTSKGRLPHPQARCRQLLALARKKFPEHPAARRCSEALGDLLLEQAKTEQAEEAYRAALPRESTVSDPGTEGILVALASLEEKKKNLGEAEPLY